jgi:diguanylate cyclase (GGDEF)-like protein/PAS domain S-box-containing protein
MVEPRSPLFSSQETELTQLRDTLHRFISLVNSLPGVAFTAHADREWSMRFVSIGCQQLTGYSAADLTAADSPVNYSRLTHPDDHQRVLDTITKAIDQGQPYGVEYRLVHRSGEIRWVWEKGQAALDSSGQLHGLEGFITDISELKATEQALRQSEARYRLLADNANDLISRHRLDGRCDYLSPACRALLGYAPESLVDQQPLDWVHPDDQPMVRRFWRLLLVNKADAIAPLSYRIRHCQGHYIWLETTGCPVTAPAALDLPPEIIAISRDVSDRKAAERTLREREAMLQLVMDALPQYAFWKNRDSVYLGSNRRFAQMSGAGTPENLVGKTDQDLTWTEEEKVLYVALDREVMDNDQPVFGAIEPQRYADGRHRWSETNKIPLHDDNGQVIGLLGTFQDITERVATQDALAQREQYLAALVQLQSELLFPLRGSNAPDHYQNILAPLGQATGASRVYVYLLEVGPEAEQTGGLPQWAVQQAEWSADDVASTLNPAEGEPSLKRLPLTGGFARWAAALAAGEVVNQVATDFTPDQQQWLCGPPANVRTLLLLPITLRGRLHGLVGFTRCDSDQTWSRSEIDLLRIAAASLSMAYERQIAEKSLTKAELKYRSIFENAVEGIFQSTPSGHYLTVNPMLARLYGYDSPEELIQTLTDIDHQLYVQPERRQEFVCQIQQLGSVIGFESEVYRKDGSTIWISESARAIYHPDGNQEIVGYEGTVEDISQRKQAEAELHHRDKLLQGVADASNCLLIRPQFELAVVEALEILGKAATADRVYIYQNHLCGDGGELGMSMRFEWTQPNVLPSLDQPHWQGLLYHQHGLQRWYDAFVQGHSISGIVADFPPAEQALLGKDKILSILMVPIFVEEQFWGYIGFDACREARQWTNNEESILVAIAASIGGAIRRQYAEEQMRYQAFHDLLTGLPNRMLFNQHLPLALAHARRANQLLGVIFLDLDRFKTINDTLGHAVGDQLLQQATRRLTSALREEDTIARWGGDEFTLILPSLKSAEDAAKVAERLFAALKPAFFLDGHELYITSSVGIALYPNDGEDMDTLLKNADAAMYRAKEQGRNNYQFYTAKINSQASHLLTLENSLHHALERQQFVVYYQPQFNVVTGEITQVEALLRWQHPQLGLVSPQTFITIAEENGLIVPIGEWVLRVACQQNYAWHQAGLTNLRVAVNLSPRQLQHPELVSRVEKILQETHLEAQFLELEITETAAMRDVDATVDILSRLQKMKVRIAMDDFGTGYSSLSYLKKFPLNSLKIDRAFVQDLTHSPEDKGMIAAIIALGQCLNLNIIAEGVETKDQLDCLKALNCEEMQGHWFSPPQAAELITQLLRSHPLAQSIR